jgi:tetratricopeptide (TPR) repeat protein
MLWQKAWSIYTNPAAFDRKKQVTEKEVADEQRALYDYLKATKPWWEKANDLSTYYDRVVSCQVYFVKDKDERDRLVEEAVAYVKTVQSKDKVIADGQLSRLVDVLRDGRAYERGRYVASLMTDKLAAAYKEYELLSHEASQVDGARWPAAEQALLALEAGGTPEWRLRAMGERARIYREYLNQQEKAIALYQQMNNPPHNLWSIQECYKRMGKLENAMGVLTEIENSFPDFAPRAAWHKAAYLKEAGDAKKAVAQGRRILKLYPKSPESSQAHQLLEEYGIATGGGLKEDEQ